MWDAESGERAQTLRASTSEPVTTIDVSADGRVAAAAGERGVRLWDADGQPVPLDVSEAFDVSWSPDGSALAVAGGQGQVHVADPSGTELAVLGTIRRWPRRRRDSAPTADCSPWLRSRSTVPPPFDRAAPGGETLIWDWRRARVERMLPVAARSVAFSSDGRLVAVVAMTGPWDARTGHQELVLRGHAGLVSDVDFSLDGSKLVSTGPEGVARVWALDLEDLIAIARRWVTRSLTAAECRQYLRGEECRS